jgi:pimeloyl-ACP methyl ester carboxylesterase
VWRTATVGGARVRFLDTGAGDPLLFLHGWGLTPRVYLRAITPLARAGIRVIAPAMRGATVDELADGVAAFLDTLALDEPVFVMGHSLGGGTGIRLATTRPDLVRSLTLVNSVGGAPGRRTGMTSQPWWRWALGAATEAHPRAISPRVLADVVRDFVPTVARAPLTSLRSAGAALSADLADDVRRLVDDGLPVLFVWGDRDRLIAPGAFAEVAGGLPPEVVAGRHGWLLTAPEEFATLLRNALVVHATLERSRRGQRVPPSGALFPHERRHRARRGDSGTRASS